MPYLIKIWDNFFQVVHKIVIVLLVQTRHSSKPVYASARLRLKALFCVVIAFISTKFLKQPFFALIAVLPAHLNSNVAINSQIAEEAALTEPSVRVT